MNISEVVQSLTDYIKNSYQELQKVVWPTKQETLKYSIAVISISIFIAVFFGVADYIFNFILSLLISA